MDKTALGDRMKVYEDTYRNKLPRRTYTLIRLDGKAFHTWTKGAEKPFDKRIAICMEYALLQLASEVSGFKLGYTQSDEISLLLTDFSELNTQAWFDGNIQKIVSVSASIVTHNFNQMALNIFGPLVRPASFDARVFTIPEQPEVFNYFMWRFRDCMRNSIQSAGQKYFSQKQLHGKNTDQIQEMLFQEHGINWSEYPEWFKNGSFLYRNENAEDKKLTFFTANIKLEEEKKKVLDLIPLPNTWVLE